MSYKIATYMTLLLISALAFVFFFSSMEFASLQSRQPISPASFPQIISVLLIIMSVISFFTTRKQIDEKVDLPNFKYIVYTIILVIVFLILWEIIGYFFILMVILFATLFYLYNDSPIFTKKVLSSLVQALIVGTIIYIIFAKILHVVF